MNLRVRLGVVAEFGHSPTAVRIGSRSFFVLQDAAGLRLVSDVCPHQGGAVFDQGDHLECPIHGWRFDRTTGRCLNAPSRALASFPLVVDDGAVYAELPPEPVDSGDGLRSTTAAGLTLTLHSHACLEIARDGFTLLTDPWLDGPAFFSAWAPHPPPAVSGRELKPDAILITHEHSDHFHEPTLRHFDRRTPIYVPDFPNQRLQRRLAALGFNAVHVLRFGERHGLGTDWTLTAFEPDSYWNDALVLIDAAGFRIFDINDAGLNPRIARMVGAVDLLAVQFSAGASGYPWTWSHLGDAQKIAISEQMCAGKLKLIADAAATYRAASVLPFASHFALWHEQHQSHAAMMKRNTLEDVRAALAGTSVNLVDLMPGDTWHAGSGVIDRGAPVTVTFDRQAFATAFPADESLSPDELAAYLLRLNQVPEIDLCEDLTVRITGRSTAGYPAVDVAFAVTAGRVRMLDAMPDRANITMTMPLSILTAVIRDDLSWDEAFIGYWCSFDRHPNVYHAGFWRLFQAPYFQKAPRLHAAAEAASINRHSTVAQVLETHGAAADRVLRRHGLYCFGCHHSTSESIELAARQHGVDPRHVDLIVKELNRAAAGGG